MRLTKRTLKALQDLSQGKEISEKELQDYELLKVLLEDRLIRRNLKGKTRKYLIAVNIEGLKSYIRSVYDIDIQEDWKVLVKNSRLPDALKKVLSDNEIKIEGKSYSEIVANIENGLSSITPGMTKRQISAILFWGMSKVLDNKMEIVEALSGSEVPLLLNVCGGSDRFEQISFIENYDTYIYLINTYLSPKNLFIYSAGFQGSAKRLRQNGGCAIHYASVDGLSQVGRERFQSWLWNCSEESIPHYFFGDFDFSAMQIFSSLKATFPQIQLDQKHYDKMVTAVRRGNGHTPKMADKKEQKDLGEVGDAYCDEVLLPTMRELGFFDQEGVVDY
ncbi:hypothetical protein RZR97_01980 [Hydrogenimonas thermophila]|uniref:hypothetical protein n=1 Tax=Hydrogenimonas thermophila TaxID=223786 RepID=UPI0029370615|nr:hypothetical protein [Hydrogenimonas thermophila]WOE70353.1 hypothetical protein RZR91_01990 [Hydrogenimonas thermophila]WOE72870.1 hypothetical protein RZR97_01980 [Hydrogenimonas thermophila]